MLKTSTRLLPLLLTTTLALGACGNDAGSSLLGPSGNSPEAAVTSTIKLMRAGDFGKLAHSALPAADYTRVAAEWTKQVADDSKISAEDRAKFAAQMAVINAPDCAAKLFTTVSPLLSQYQSKYQAQLPMYLGVGQTMAATAIDQAKELDPAQKQQAKDVLASLATWVQGTNWGDAAKAKQALAIVCDTGRGLDLTTLDAVRKLDFDHLLGKYGQAWNGAVKVLALYGFDVNAMLDSAQVKTVSNDGKTAVVSTTMTMFGKPVTSESKMVQQDGHWYSKDLLDSFKDDATTAASTGTAAGAH